MTTASPTNRPRRGRGEGGIRKRPDGRWEASIHVGYGPDGKRKRKFVYGRTRADVQEKLRQEQQRIASGLAPTDGRRTTEQFLRWWRTAVLPGTVSRSSEETYSRVLELYVIPSVGRVLLARLAPADVTAMMRAMADGRLGRRKLAPQTQNQARKVLSKALRRAEQEGLVARNAASLADAPHLARSEARSMAPDQAATLLAALGDQRMGVAYVLQLALGLRRGETLGLTWDHVDLDSDPPLVCIRRQLRRFDEGGLVLTDLKTPQSRRDLVLPAPVATQLRAWRTQQARERLAAGPVWVDSAGLVFTTPVGTPVDPANYRHRLARITERAGLGRWSTHELRHSAGSFLFAAGVPMKLISETLGHSSERVTSDVYVHTALAARTQVAAAMAGMLWSVPGDAGGPDQLGGQLGGQSAPHPAAPGR